MNRAPLFVAILLGAGFLGADGPPSDAVKEELKKLEGTWKPVSGERGGEQAPEEVFKDGKLVIEGGKWVEHLAKDRVAERRFTIDPTKDPKTIDLIEQLDAFSKKDGVTKQEKKQVTTYGIYRLEGDKLTVCVLPSSINDESKDRPTIFRTKKGLPWAIVIFERVKP
jgi:uncharacterized protein (TIGR03067 family)